MRLTPLDIQNAEFDRSLSGFRPKQVRAFLERVADEREGLLKELQALQEQVETQQRRIDELAAAEADLKHAVIAAERIAEQVRRNAEEEGRLMLADVEQRRRALEADLAGLRTSRDAFREQFRGLLQAFERTLDFPNAGDGNAEGEATLDPSDLHEDA
mgnify:CR=1 FL=1